MNLIKLLSSSYLILIGLTAATIATATEAAATAMFVSQ